MATTNPPTPGKQWADGPCPMVHTPMYETNKEDIFTKGSSHMALLHNAILRGYNTIYLQAEHVQPADYADFIGYSLAWFKFVKGHHDDEEENLFPKVEEVIGKKDIWEESLKEHETFLEGLGKFNTYLSTLPSPSDFSGKELISIMDTFQEPFNHHFHSEISTIANMSSYGDFPEAGPIFATWGKQSIMKAGMTDVVPFLFLNFDRSFEEGKWATWPPMPGPIRWLLTRAGSSWHWGWWKFSSCDVNGTPQDLYASS
ncbi:MAG: hypothetical protein M1834_002319 [Cirrosporium novae-zelandiae]|nr:MAG: hypothetical protein M1834_002319 [Cirrosporium novae-zelandiae]